MAPICISELKRRGVASGVLGPSAGNDLLCEFVSGQEEDPLGRRGDLTVGVFAPLSLRWEVAGSE